MYSHLVKKISVGVIIGLITSCGPQIGDITQEVNIQVDREFLESLLTDESEAKIDINTQRLILNAISNSIEGLNTKNFDLFSSAFAFEEAFTRNIYDRLIQQNIRHFIKKVRVKEASENKAIVTLDRITVTETRISEDSFSYELTQKNQDWKISDIPSAP